MYLLKEEGWTEWEPTPLKWELKDVVITTPYMRYPKVLPGVQLMLHKYMALDETSVGGRFLLYVERGSKQHLITRDYVAGVQAPYEDYPGWVLTEGWNLLITTYGITLGDTINVNLFCYQRRRLKEGEK